MTAVRHQETSPITAHEVRFKSFSTVRRGFDPHEVGDYLYLVAEELLRRDELEMALRHAAEQTRAELHELRGEIQRGPNPQSVHQLGRAQLSAEQIVGRAQEQAKRIVGDARRRAAGIWAQAEQAAGVGMLNLSELVYQANGDWAASIREQAASLEEARRQVEVARQHLKGQLSDIIEAAQSAQEQLHEEELPAEG